MSTGFKQLVTAGLEFLHKDVKTFELQGTQKVEDFFDFFPINEKNIKNGNAKTKRNDKMKN